MPTPAWRELIHECVEAGVDLIDHGDEVDAEIIEMMLERGTYWVPSMRVLDVALGISAGGSVPSGRARRRADAGARRVGQPRQWLPVANEAGVKILTGDDYGVPIVPHVPGIYSTRARHVCGAGRDRSVGRAALGHATSPTCSAWPASWARSRPGALADLIVVRGDPSRDITLLQDPAANLAAVMKDGAFVKDELATVV